MKYWQKDIEILFDNPEWRNSLRARRNLRRMRGGANNSSNGVDRFADTKSEGHLVDESIIEELKYFFYRTKDTSLFVDKSRRRWKNPNIYTLYNLLSPSNEVNIDEL